MMSGVGHGLSGIDALKYRAQIRFRTAALCGAVVMLALASSEVLAGERDVTPKDTRLSFLSRPGDPDAKTEKPAEEPPRAVPQEERRNFDGQWVFTGSGCPNAGSVPAKIVGGKIFVKGGGGQVDPDGTLHSVGAGNGITLTAVGQLSGNTGSGTFTQSDGCIGRWIAVKQGDLRKRR
jgi:hypothetical protein